MRHQNIVFKKLALIGIYAVRVYDGNTIVSRLFCARVYITIINIQRDFLCCCKKYGVLSDLNVF